MRKSETGEAPAPTRLGPSAEQLAAHRISPRFYNADLAPARKEGRSWTAYSVFTLWANDVHSLGNYGFALGLFALGLGAWQILVALLVGAALLFFLLTLSGFMGYKTGVPYPVMSRISFGIHGAQLAASVRGIVAIAWFGIQTYLASSVLNVMLLTMFPGLQSWADAEFLGLSGLGWFSFSLLWVIQVIIVSYGMEMIRRYEAIAGPIILVTFLALAVWMLIRVDFSNFYHRGVNWRAIGAFIPASAISLVFALVPAFSGISEFSWFSGAAIAALIYFVIARRDFTFREVDGEEIAVPTHH